MAKNAADILRDDLVSHDVRVRRALGGFEGRQSQRFAEFERVILAELVRIDPLGPKTITGKERRIAEFERRVRELTDEFYRGRRAELNEALDQLAGTEVEALITALSDLGADLEGDRE